MPSKVWGEFTYPFRNCSGYAVEFGKCQCYFIPNLIVGAVTYPCQKVHPCSINLLLQFDEAMLYAARCVRVCHVGREVNPLKCTRSFVVLSIDVVILVGLVNLDDVLTHVILDLRHFQGQNSITDTCASKLILVDVIWISASAKPQQNPQKHNTGKLGTFEMLYTVA